MRSLGNVYMEQDKFQLAESLYKDAKCRAVIQFGSADSLTTFIIGKLGTLYQGWQLWTEAETMHRRAIPAQLDSEGMWHEDTMESVRKMALLFAVQGMLKRARTLLRRCAERYEELLGHADNDAIESIRFQVQVIEDRMLWCRRHGISENLLRQLLAKMRLRLTEQNRETIQEELLQTPIKLREAELQRLDDESDESGDDEYHLELSDDSDGEQRSIHIYGKARHQVYGSKDAAKTSNKHDTHIYPRPRSTDTTLILKAEETNGQSALFAAQTAGPSPRNRWRPPASSVLPNSWTGPTVEEISDEENAQPFSTPSSIDHYHVENASDVRNSQDGGHKVNAHGPHTPSEAFPCDIGPQLDSAASTKGAHIILQMPMLSPELDIEHGTRRSSSHITVKEASLEHDNVPEGGKPERALPPQSVIEDRAFDDCSDSASSAQASDLPASDYKPETTSRVEPASAAEAEAAIPETQSSHVAYIAQPAIVEELSVVNDSISIASSRPPAATIETAEVDCHEHEPAIEDARYKTAQCDQETPIWSGKKAPSKRKKQVNDDRHKRSHPTSRRRTRRAPQCCLQ
ncbi:Putative tetratricopeptide-like helical domain superfamily [Septoria linicola]|uniref:Tetratricopeptide-like helical domain superfamily n=1 Tax=Septoria linicola TaxID=215465 RepID=A0A9Q9EPT7_9PEZI|nr:Putative tetratricopeptide-like helical domain superfamily [Septoria linicola]